MSRRRRPARRAQRSMLAELLAMFGVGLFCAAIAAVIGAGSRRR